MDSGTHILLVDDDPQIRIVFGEMLADEGYIVQTVPNGQAALTRLDSFPADLMLTDLQMPGMDGIDLIRSVRQEHPGLPTILLTALRSGDAQGMLDRSGANAFCEKPVEVDVLLATIEQVLHPPGLHASDPHAGLAG